jgi:hypothetical protein
MKWNRITTRERRNNAMPEAKTTSDRSKHSEREREANVGQKQRKTKEPGTCEREFAAKRDREEKLDRVRQLNQHPDCAVCYEKVCKTFKVILKDS